LRALLFFLPAWVLSGVIESAVFQLSGPGTSVVSILTFSRGAIAAVLLFLSFLYLTALDQRSPRSLGLWFYPRWGRELVWGAAAGAVWMAISVAVLVLGRGVAYSGSNVGSGETLLFQLRVCGMLLAGAAMEEVLFRGYGFQRLLDSLGTVGAVTVMSILFSAVHIENGSVTALSSINTALAGVLLSVAYLRTRALWLPIGLHWAWNFFQGGIFSLPVSGIRFAQPLLRAASVGPAWFTGGSYGPEGGVVVTVVSICGILWIARTRRLCTSPAMREVLQ
jgi:membrane protease YdiL (CAAX protease family)